LAYKEAKLIFQKMRKLGEEQREATREEVDKLLEVRFIMESHYIMWLENVVFMKKENGK